MTRFNIVLFLITFFVLESLAFVVSAGSRAQNVYSNSVGIDFTLIPADAFTMGLTPTEKDSPQSILNATTAHRVTISKPFYIGKYEVTQAQWVEVMGRNPSYSGGINDYGPVNNVSWDDVWEFINKLNEMEGHKRYRLPTEAEWEYAARAGSGSAYYFGDDIGELGQYAWFSSNSGSTKTVGFKLPNAWGLYDVSGNVSEWVQDLYSERYYSDSPPTDPPGPPSGLFRVLRGGNARSDGLACRSGSRSLSPPTTKDMYIGFRLALSVADDAGGKSDIGDISESIPASASENADSKKAATPAETRLPISRTEPLPAAMRTLA
jgi:formylglycine-generating enzyme required for sulfatase activity